MAQVIQLPQNQTFAEALGQGLGTGAGRGLSNIADRRVAERRAAELQRILAQGGGQEQILQSLLASPDLDSQEATALSQSVFQAREIDKNKARARAIIDAFSAADPSVKEALAGLPPEALDDPEIARQLAADLTDVFVQKRGLGLEERRVDIQEDQFDLDVERFDETKRTNRFAEGLGLRDLRLRENTAAADIMVNTEKLRLAQEELAEAKRSGASKEELARRELDIREKEIAATVMAKTKELELEGRRVDQTVAESIARTDQIIQDTEMAPQELELKKLQLNAELAAGSADYKEFQVRAQVAARQYSIPEAEATHLNAILPEIHSEINKRFGTFEDGVFSFSDTPSKIKRDIALSVAAEAAINNQYDSGKAQTTASQHAEEAYETGAWIPDEVVGAGPDRTVRFLIASGMDELEAKTYYAEVAARELSASDPTSFEKHKKDVLRQLGVGRQDRE